MYLGQSAFRIFRQVLTVLTLGNFGVSFIIFTLFFFLVFSNVSSFYHLHYISFLVSILMFVPPSMLYKHGSIYLGLRAKISHQICSILLYRLWGIPFIWGRLFEGFFNGLKWQINQLFL
jgi:hypothetical protein